MATVIDFKTRAMTTTETGPEPQVDPDILAVAERIYELAKNGEINGLACAVSHRSGEASTSFAADKANFTLGGAVTWLFHRYGRHLTDY